MDLKSEIKGHLRTARESVEKARRLEPPAGSVPSDWPDIVDGLAGVERLIGRLDSILGDAVTPPKKPKPPAKARQEDVGQAKESTTASAPSGQNFTAPFKVT
jgi:hypothetical protein